jgi:hypothetical protein
MDKKALIFERYEKYENDLSELNQEEQKLTSRFVKVLTGAASRDARKLHSEFFADIKRLTEEFAAERPCEADADEVACFMLREKSSDPRDTLALSLLAAEQYAAAVIPFMSPDGRASLREKYLKRDKTLLKSPAAAAVIRALK